MYWLRWHYHVKDIAGALYKIKKKERKKRKKTKQQNRWQVNVFSEHFLMCLNIVFIDFVECFLQLRSE